MESFGGPRNLSPYFGPTYERYYSEEAPEQVAAAPQDEIIAEPVRRSYGIYPSYFKRSKCYTKCL